MTRGAEATETRVGYRRAALRVRGQMIAIYPDARLLCKALRLDSGCLTAIGAAREMRRVARRMVHAEGYAYVTVIRLARR